MSFMQKEIVKDSWYEIDGSNGTYWIPADFLPDFTREEMDRMEDEQFFKDFEKVYNGDIWAVDRVEGWGARLSAPGYMDCTEWSVFETEQEAIEWLEETYGDNDSNEESVQ